MKNGDISCNLAPVIAFNLSTLVKIEESKNPLKKILHRKKVDLNILATINKLWDRYNYRIFIVSLDETEEALEKLLGNFPLYYTKFERVTLEELTWKCKNEFTYYYDTDYNRISVLNSRCAKHITEIHI